MSDEDSGGYICETEFDILIVLRTYILQPRTKCSNTRYTFSPVSVVISYNNQVQEWKCYFNILYMDVILFWMKGQRTKFIVII